MTISISAPAPVSCARIESIWLALKGMEWMRTKDFRSRGTKASTKLRNGSQRRGHLIEKGMTLMTTGLSPLFWSAGEGPATTMTVSA